MSSFADLDLAAEPLEPLVGDVDGVFHLAARPGVRTSWGSSFASYLRDNLWVTQRVFEAAVNEGVRVVYASSSSVYGTAESYPLREDVEPLARVPVRGLEAGVRVPGERLWVLGRPRRGGAEVLLGVRAPATAGHGVRQRLRVTDSLPPVPPARRREPDSGLHLRRRHRRGYAAGHGTRGEWACLQRRRRLRGLAAGRAGAVRAHRRANRSTCTATGRWRATRAARSPTSARPRPSWDGRPPRRWRMVSAPRPRASRCRSPSRGSIGQRPSERPNGRHASGRPRRGARHPVLSPPRGGCRAAARAARVRSCEARGIRTEIFTRAVRGWPRTEPIPGSVVHRTPVAGESPLASLAYVAVALGHILRRRRRHRPRPCARRAVPGHDRPGRAPARAALPRHRPRHG